MGSDHDHGPDADAIRRWLEQRDTYSSDPGRHRAEAAAPAPATDPDPDDRRDVGRDIVEALGGASRADSDETPTAGPTEAAASDTEAGAGTVPPDEQSSGVATDQVFQAPATARRVLGVILLVTLAAAAVAGYLAYDDPSTATYGIAGTFVVLALVVWAVRASTTRTQVQVRRGVLEVRRGGGLEVADLANPYTPIAILGTPQRRNWRVLVERPGQPLIELDASMVEPIAFTGLLLRLRPELWDAAADEARSSIGLNRPS